MDKIFLWTRITRKTLNTPRKIPQQESLAVKCQASMPGSDRSQIFTPKRFSSWVFWWILVRLTFRPVPRTMQSYSSSMVAKFCCWRRKAVRSGRRRLPWCHDRCSASAQTSASDPLTTKAFLYPSSPLIKNPLTNLSWIYLCDFC